jgi:hypothetical protein
MAACACSDATINEAKTMLLHCLLIRATPILFYQLSQQRDVHELTLAEEKSTGHFFINYLFAVL